MLILLFYYKWCVNRVLWFLYCRQAAFRVIFLLDFIEKELEKFRKKFITINIVIGGLKFKNNYLE